MPKGGFQGLKVSNLSSGLMGGGGGAGGGDAPEAKVGLLISDTLEIELELLTCSDGNMQKSAYWTWQQKFSDRISGQNSELAFMGRRKFHNFATRLGDCAGASVSEMKLPRIDVFKQSIASISFLRSRVALIDNLLTEISSNDMDNLRSFETKPSGVD